LLFVGSGFARKGLDTLIEALAGLGDRRAWLVVAGKGAVEEHAGTADQLGLGDRIRWLGPRRDVERLYAAADAVALPARYEPFGNVHLEALAAGLPVLTSRRAGGAEVIRDGENGWVVPPADPAALAGALGRLRDGNPEAMATAARRAAEPFTHAAWVEALAAVYRKLGAHPPGPIAPASAGLH
jgi:UDP-glucose:(heptosyl)LPS alpha-1,3-glucosyltransferase